MKKHSVYIPINPFLISPQIISNADLLFDRVKEAAKKYAINTYGPRAGTPSIYDVNRLQSSMRELDDYRNVKEIIASKLNSGNAAEVIRFSKEQISLYKGRRNKVTITVSKESARTLPAYKYWLSPHENKLIPGGDSRWMSDQRIVVNNTLNNVMNGIALCVHKRNLYTYGMQYRAKDTAMKTLHEYINGEIATTILLAII